MGTVVRFSPDLSAWITHNLAAGHAPAALVGTMRAQNMAAEVAQAIMDAFVAARLTGRSVPVDSITIDEAVLAYQYEAPRMASGSLIATRDRAVRVLARAARPALAVLGDVLGEDECAQLIALARPRLRPSTLVDPDSGRDVVKAERTSLGMFFRPAENALVERIDQRLADVMNLPVDHGEGIQVLCYPAEAQSTPHYDFLVPSNAANEASIARSGQRVSTLVAYLNDVDGGGETVFPEAGWAVAPQRGNAVYFEYCNSRGQLDHATLHAGAPVARGEKWVATKWMRQRRFIAAG